MNRKLLIAGLMLVLVIPQAWGASTQYPNPYRQTMWNNLTDKIHTLGQTPQQARVTIIKLHNARTQERIKSINQAKQDARGY